MNISHLQLYHALQARLANEPDLHDETLIAPSTSRFDMTFLKACFEMGMLDTVSAVSVHPYRSTIPETVSLDYAEVNCLGQERSGFDFVKSSSSLFRRLAESHHAHVHQPKRELSLALESWTSLNFITIFRLLCLLHAGTDPEW